MPTVSAIIPCFNGAEWLGEAIASIQQQTMPVAEIIVVDDCSTDDSAAIARRCGAKLVRNAVNCGEGYSRNHGIRSATGSLIASLDADDVWLPRHVETLVGLLERYPQATAAFGAVQRFGLRHEVIRGYIPRGEPTNVFWFAFEDWVHTTIGSMVRKQALLDIDGFDETQRYAVDYDLWLRLSRDHLFTCTHEVTSRWRWHELNQSANGIRQMIAVYRFRDAYVASALAQGHEALVTEARRRMPAIWRRDISDAWRSRDLPLVRFLSRYAGDHIEGISMRERLRWSLRSMIPRPALTYRDRWLGSKPANAG